MAILYISVFPILFITYEFLQYINFSITTRFKYKAETNNLYVINKMILILCHKKENLFIEVLSGVRLKLHLTENFVALELILHMHVHLRAEIFYSNRDVI